MIRNHPIRDRSSAGLCLTTISEGTAEGERAAGVRVVVQAGTVSGEAGGKGHFQTP